MTGLTAEQLRQRDGKLTASRVAVLMNGDEQGILDLWRYMVGDPSYEEPDLSNVWAVRLGQWTEPLALDWYARRTGRKLTRRGDVVISRLANWAAATLDAWDDELGCPVECKHVGGYEGREKVIERYQPQCHWQMLCTNARQVMLSIIEGAKEPVIEPIEFDANYADELWHRAEVFMQCVRDLTPPIALAAVTAPEKAAKVYSMQGNNSWAIEAGTWLEKRVAAKAFQRAEADLKEMVPSDAARCHGHGIEVKRDRAGRLSIKPLEA